MRLLFLLSTFCLFAAFLILDSSAEILLVVPEEAEIQPSGQVDLVHMRSSRIDEQGTTAEARLTASTTTGRAGATCKVFRQECGPGKIRGRGRCCPGYVCGRKSRRCKVWMGGGAPVTYKAGALTVSAGRLRMSTGLRLRVIARSGLPVSYMDGSQSIISFHGKPDAGAIFPDPSPTNSGGWVYVSNSEVSDNEGGVGAITFDRNGDPINYKMVLTGTSRNCGGGKTYWNTWISCEENKNDGQIYEVDPFGRNAANLTVLGGSGGNFESVAYDRRDRLNPHFYVTNDSKDGEIRRFTTDFEQLEQAKANGGYHSILTTPGTLEYLVLVPNNKAFYWTKDIDLGRQSAELYFNNCEGIGVSGNFLYFVSKEQKELFVLDLGAMTYSKSSTLNGFFDDEPDQFVQVVGGKSEHLYFTEDGGRAGIHVRDQQGQFTTIIDTRSDETTGLAFSLNRRHMYFAIQDEGVLFEITRDDGRPFER